MSISNQSDFVSTIMLDIIDEMDSNSFVSFRYSSTDTMIVKDIVTVHQFKLLFCDICPLGVAIALI